MPDTTQVSLFVQCVHRAAAFFSRKGFKPIASHVEISAIWLMQQAAKNQNRIPSDSEPNPRTGFPDDYLDTILELAAFEGPYVAALMEGDEEAWATMQKLITARVRSYVRRYFGSAPQRGAVLEEDIVQECSMDFWDWIRAYPYDCKLEAWITQCISYKVLGIRESADCRRALREVSIDEPDDQDGEGLLATLADDRALHAFSQAELKIMLHLALRRLPPLQRQAILSILRGEDIEECSRRLGRSTNAVYKLRERARKSLRQYLES